MLDTISLSFIIATRNRLPFLKITLQRLIDTLEDDEEIVIVDGDSTDGSKQYLQTLFAEGKIHQFISEPDKNQAHAWNKAMLMAKGTIIKKIIDDDVFCYDAIRECKNFMLLKQQVDIVISNDLGSAMNNPQNIEKYSRLPQFEKWKNGLVPSFTFGDVHMLIRKNSLSFIGLYNTAFVMMDWEYSLRISYLKANIAFYTGYNALSVAHPQSVSAQKNSRLIEEQGKRGCIFYEYDGDRAEISTWSKIKIQAGKILKPAREDGGKSDDKPLQDIGAIYNYFYDYIAEINRSEQPEFFRKD